MKKTQFYKDLDKRFGYKLYSKKFDYKISIQDLYDAAQMFNKYIFGNKLDIDSIEIISVDYSKQKDKGNTSFGKCNNPQAKYLIQIVKFADGDNFFQILNVLAHEMIHVYDFSFGQIFKMITQHCSEILSGFYVVNANKKQYVGDDKYDAHGKYFKLFADKFNSYGFDVQEKYSLTNRKCMKKLEEHKEDNQICHFFNETDDSKETMTYKVVKQMFDRIIAPGKRLVYRNAKEWFIEFS